MGVALRCISAQCATPSNLPPFQRSALRPQSCLRNALNLATISAQHDSSGIFGTSSVFVGFACGHLIYK